MRVMAKVVRLWRSLFQKRRLEHDLNEELRSYLEEQVDRKIRAGESPEAARRRARMELGGVEQLKEACREVRSMQWGESLAQDVGYGLRALRRHPAVTAIALVSLSLGIGANTLVFSFLYELLLRPLPYPERHRIILVESSPRGGDPQQRASLNRSDCSVLGDAAEIFEAFGCYTGDIGSSLAGAGPGEAAAERLPGQRFTAGLPRALGMQPLLGRWFTRAEEEEGADSVILISYGLWQRRFGGAPDVLGQTLRFDGERATIIGVMPEDFEFIESNAQYWVPFRSPDAGLQSPARILGGIARLKSGLGLEAAQSRLDALALRLEEQSPEVHKGWRLLIESLEGRIREERIPTAAITLQGAVAFVLLIACGNVAGLLLAHGVNQQKELAIRTALGSGRWRLIRQSLTHSLMLCVLGGVLGLATGAAGTQILRNALPGGLPQPVYNTTIDETLFLFTFGVVLACGLLVGIVPAFHVSRAQSSDVLKEWTATATAGVARQRLRKAFVVVQIALALVLLVGAGLMLISLKRVGDYPLGFDPGNLLTAAVQLPEGKLRKSTNTVIPSGALGMQIDPQAQLMTERIQENLGAIPGVASASAIAIHPPLGGALNMPLRVEDRSFEEPQRAQFLPVMPDYFKTLQVRILQGREFGPQDTGGNVQVAIINESMARRYWPGENPLGRQVRIDTPLLPNEQPRRIVGVVADVMQYSGQQDRPQFYLPYSQLPMVYDERFSSDFGNITFIIRTAQPIPQIMPAIMKAVANADATQAVSSVQTMWRTAYGKPARRVFAGLIGVFAGIAVMLAAIGIYGVMAQIVSQRTNEIGIRMALGANARDVRRLVVRQGGGLIAAGLFAGMLVAAALTRVLRSVLVDVSPTDPLTFALASALLAVIALLACYAPARRASRIDPLSALRHD